MSAHLVMVTQGLYGIGDWLSETGKARGRLQVVWQGMAGVGSVRHHRPP